jgi:SAM-dependent methyltransferase
LTEIITPSENNDYRQWKGWTEGFGALSRGESAYFAKETREFRAVGDVLELGFGNGSFLAFATKQGWQPVGTEMNSLLVEAGREMGFKVMPADQLATLPDESFDLIAAFDVLEHVASDDVVELLLLLKSKLRATGHILLRFPNADHWLGNVAQNGDPTHQNAIGYFKIVFYAQQAGLTLKDFRGQAKVGFSNGLKWGIHYLFAAPIISFFGFLNKMLHYPGVPVVLSSQNVVVVLAH